VPQEKSLAGAASGEVDNTIEIGVDLLGRADLTELRCAFGNGKRSLTRGCGVAPPDAPQNGGHQILRIEMRDLVLLDPERVALDPGGLRQSSNREVVRLHPRDDRCGDGAVSAVLRVADDDVLAVTLYVTRLHWGLEVGNMSL
jgi:hypothetical protein